VNIPANNLIAIKTCHATTIVKCTLVDCQLKHHRRRFVCVYTFCGIYVVIFTIYLQLDEAFSKYGRLRKVWVARRPPGFAFIQFEDVRDAEDAVKALDGA
jgi:hypothetical protein